MGKKKGGANDGWGKVPTKDQQKKATKEKKQDTKQERQQKRAVALAKLHDQTQQLWTHRTKSDKTSDLIAMQPGVIPGLYQLLSQYPHIVYLGFSFWRKLLYLRPAESQLGYHDLLSKSCRSGKFGPHDYPVCLGALGGLKYLDFPRCLLTPTPTIRSGVIVPLFRETRPLSIALLDEYDDSLFKPPTKPKDVNLVAARKEEVVKLPRPKSKWRGWSFRVDTKGDWTDGISDHDCHPRYSSVDLFVHFAVCNNQIDCMNVLIRDLGLLVDDPWYDGYRSNECYYEENGKTMLHVAAQHSSHQMVRLLLDNGADVNKVDLVGSNAAVYAVWGGNVAILRMLLEAGVTVEDKSQSPTSLLRIAVDRVEVEMVELLLEHGAMEEDEKRFGGGSLLQEALARQKKISNSKKKTDPEFEGKLGRIVELLQAAEE